MHRLVMVGLLAATASALSCSRSVAPDENVAAARAEQFIGAIAMRRDPRYAFDLLTAPARAALETNWSNVFAALRGDLVPERVHAVAIGPPAGHVLPVYVEGEAALKRVCWRVDVAADDDYFVHDAERVEAVPAQAGTRKYTAAGPSTDVRELRHDARVAFVSVDAGPTVIEGLAQHFADRLHVATEILPSLKPDAASWNQSRQQLIAEEIAHKVANRFGDVLENPATTIIAVTRRDMYIRGYSWRFAMSYRLRPNVAVVSWARMDPRALGAPDDPKLLETRLRKMVGKNIGLLAYGLPATSNPRSLLFNGVLAVQDLDVINGDYAYAGMRAY
jgi:predicted Zn-dependent protease